ncbi:MAG: hypothetical protein JST40_09170 [Armatimonadetes bacterium]|nr:hypothetical protein [Armatimonadota bacterium]
MKPVVLSLLTVFVVSAPVAQQSHSKWNKTQKVCELDNKQINESSGIARSYLAPGQYYTHNDSGDTARFFRFDLKGHVSGEWNLSGVKATDWEDIASAKIKGKSYLYIGDIGDNKEIRPEIQIYKVPEPTQPSGKIVNFETYQVAYPDGAHNAETLLVDQKTGDVWIVTKTDKGPSSVYKLTAPAKSGKYTLKKMGTVEVGSIVPGSKLLTGGDVSPNNGFVVLRTYLAAFEFTVTKNFDTWFTAKPTRLELGVEGQGEAICYSTDGNSILTTSEGTPCPVSRGSFSTGSAKK